MKPHTHPFISLPAIRPGEPTLVDRPPGGPGWLHEVKHEVCGILSASWARKGLEPAAAGTHRLVRCDRRGGFAVCLWTGRSSTAKRLCSGTTGRGAHHQARRSPCLACGL